MLIILDCIFLLFLLIFKCLLLMFYAWCGLCGFFIFAGLITGIVNLYKHHQNNFNEEITLNTLFCHARGIVYCSLSFVLIGNLITLFITKTLSSAVVDFITQKIKNISKSTNSKYILE